MEHSGKEEYTDAQNLAIAICNRQNGSPLIGAFWKEPLWKKKFIVEIVKINALLQIYTANDLREVLAENKWIKTFLMKSIVSYCEKVKSKRLLQTKIDNYNQKTIIVKDVNIAPPLATNKKQTSIDKLRSLDE